MLGTALNAQSLTIKHARAVPGAAPALQLALSVELGTRATEALQAGLMLAFDIDWQLADGRQLRRTLALRYSPLLRGYQLAIGNEPPQVFALRNGLLAAMENARLRWPGEPPCSADCGGRVRARLNLAALPAPLRLPALFDSDWDFDSGWKALESGAGDRGQGEQPTAQTDHVASLVPCPLPPAPLLVMGSGQPRLGTSP